MKKIFKPILGLVIATTMLSAVSVSAVEIETFSEDLSVYYNGNNVYENSEYKPIIVNDRTMVQIKPIFELMGFSSEYDDSKKKATFSKAGDENTYSFIAEDSNIYKVNVLSEHLTIPAEMDVPAMLYKDSFYVPLRAFCEALDMEIEWINAERKVVVTNNVQAQSDLLTFNDFIGEWENISNSYLGQHMDIKVKILSVDEQSNTIKLAYKYNMGASGVWAGGSVDYCEPITVAYRKDTVTVESEDTDCTALVTEPISVVGNNNDVESIIGEEAEQLCRFTLIIPGNGNIYYAHGTSTTCHDSYVCTKIN